MSGHLEFRAGPGYVEAPHSTALWLPLGGGILRIQPRLDRMALNGRRFRIESSSVGHLNLQQHQVQTGGALGHRMLHLQAGVHLEEEELAVFGGQEFHGARAHITDCRRGGT